MNPLTLNWLNAAVAVAPQLAPEQLQAAAAQGIRSIINNRPDGEGGPDQPTTAAMQAAAAAAGLGYAHIPIPPATHTPQDALLMQQALQTLPGPILAFCRSGNRSTRLYMAAMALDS